jgi:alkylation response protein AidB-like acyl-CoA dehydrogenase
VSVAPGAGTLIGGATAESLRAWWQISLAAELVGYMDGALRLTTDYVSNRRQFGAPLGSLQAVQHRLAELFFRVEGARWLARRAAGNGALPADAAAAAVSACATAKRLVLDTHQLTGAMGLTREYDLFLWTLRAVALQQEAGGLSSHAAGLARTRWAPAAHGYQGEPTIVSVSRP